MVIIPVIPYLDKSINKIIHLLFQTANVSFTRVESIRATAAAKTNEGGIAQRTAAEHGSLGTSDNLWFSPRFLYSNLSV